MKIYSPEQVENFMDKISIHYDMICKPCSDSRVLFLKKMIDKSKSQVPIFVDLSCSTGETLHSLAKQCRGIFYGIDISQCMINMAIKKNISNSNTYFLKGDMRNIADLNLPKVDYIYSNSLEWLSNIDYLNQVVKKAYNILKPNGYLILDIINKKKFLEKLKPAYSSYIKNNNRIYLKNTIYRENNNKIVVNQIYSIVTLEDYQCETIAGEIYFTPISIEQIKESLVNKYEFLGYETNYGQEGNDYYQVICKKKGNGKGNE